MPIVGCSRECRNKLKSKVNKKSKQNILCPSASADVVHKKAQGNKKARFGLSRNANGKRSRWPLAVGRRRIRKRPQCRAKAHSPASSVWHSARARAGGGAGHKRRAVGAVDSNGRGRATSILPDLRARARSVAVATPSASSAPARLSRIASCRPAAVGHVAVAAAASKVLTIAHILTRKKQTTIVKTQKKHLHVCNLCFPFCLPHFGDRRPNAANRFYFRRMHLKFAGCQNQVEAKCSEKIRLVADFHLRPGANVCYEAQTRADEAFLPHSTTCAGVKLKRRSRVGESPR